MVINAEDTMVKVMIQGQGQGILYCFTCWKEGHTTFSCPLKDKTNICFFNMCDMGDHSLEGFPKTLENILNKKVVNILQSMPKKEILNPKNLHVIARSSAGR